MVKMLMQLVKDSWKTGGTEEIIIYGKLEMMVENVVMNYSDVMYT
jgi:hypothetical protein